jgi:hypothetical protein
MGIWGVDEEVVNAIAGHHRPSEAPAADRILALLHAADALEHNLSGTPAGESGARIDGAFLGGMDLGGRLPAWEQICREARRREATHVG